MKNLTTPQATYALFCHFLMRSLEYTVKNLRLSTEEWWPLLYPLLGGHLLYLSEEDNKRLPKIMVRTLSKALYHI